MASLSDYIDTAFDLSYLNFSKYPQTEIKSIGILGGGTAGYLAALALKKLHPKIQTSVIESSKIPVIGVGESTTTEIVPFLHRTLGIDPQEFFQAVQPTIKLGIRFDWGCPGDYHFNFNFFAGHQQESYYYEDSINNANWASVLMDNHKIPVIREKNGEMISLLQSIPFSYHIDNKNLIRFLNNIVKQRQIPIIDAVVENVHLDDNDFVTSIETDDGKKHSFDLYIDCSGFRSRILGQGLKTEFISYKSTLRNNRALTFDTPNNNDIRPYTQCSTMPNGWAWTIPMRGENHHGYVHSTDYCDEEQALKEARARFGHFEKYKMVEFRTGRHKKAWNKNVFGLGNAYGFVEPLESTAIQTAVHSIMTLCKLMPNNHHDSSSIAAINQEIAATWDTFRWFLAVHYKYNKQMDTKYWQDCRANTEMGDAQMVVDLFNQRAPLSASNLGTNSPYTACEALVFNSYSYDTLLYGQKALERPPVRPKMSKEEYVQRTLSYQELTKKALSLHELFSEDYLIEGGLLEQLFEDQDTWIVETEA
ncbi:tryptophan 7-halogenase [Bdellovibrio sp. ZAP7]|uniref:tryptophan halogenase family protein n=1 Tax=Bdellovibrio sp. ZAP7 TaxID=2231053 RepID=UPI0011578C6E|nr:tryptophan halogenase family protein [Bdellovibrio sp. ZAP7]QDK45818.1 tryptophan 7-halogenase [Bdellovibrio sp. ZAP7]